MDSFKNQALAAIDEMQGFVEYFGDPYKEALRIIDRHVFALSCGDGNFNEKLRSFQMWAKTGLSQRKYKPWGLAEVKQFATADLFLARRFADRWPDTPGFRP